MLRNGDVLGEADAPRVAWSYWHNGFNGLSDFRRLCVDTWKVLNPGWEIVMVERDSVWDYLDAKSLPGQWSEMHIPFQADAVRLALLARYGGLWIDPATICLKPFDWWLFDAIRSPCRVEGIGAFYFASWGMEMGQSAEYVENWILAARRAHPMILEWQRLFNSFWDSVRVGTLDSVSLPEHPLFAGVDLSHMQRFGHDMRSYLVMHACFKRMIDKEPSMQRLWRDEMLLLRADDHALWHVDEPAVCWHVPSCLHKWLNVHDKEWVSYVLRQCPVLKFVRHFAEPLDAQPRQRLLGECGFPCNSLAAVLVAVLESKAAQ